MNKRHCLHSLCFFFLLITACKGQHPTPAPNQNETPSPLIQDQTDWDPYFAESITVVSSHGPKSITRNILQDRKGDFWMSTWEGIIHFDGKTFTNLTNREGLRRYHTFSVMEDRAGNLWFGTIGAGLYRYDGKTFVNFTTKEGLAGDRVGCIYEDRRGNIWIGTSTGISCYDGKAFKNFTPDGDGVGNDINSILEDQNGELWFAARGAASKYNGTQFTKITNADDSEFINVRSIIQDRNGMIWMGGQCGLWRYDGTTFSKYADAFVGYLNEDRKGNIWACAGEVNTHKMALHRFDGTFLSSPGQSLKPYKIFSNDGQIFGIIEDTVGNIWFGTDRGVCRYDGSNFNWWRD